MYMNGPEIDVSPSDLSQTQDPRHPPALLQSQLHSQRSLALHAARWAQWS
jgi:hypothetical protein